MTQVLVTQPSQGQRRYTLARWGVWAVMACSGLVTAYEVYGLLAVAQMSTTTVLSYGNSLQNFLLAESVLRILVGIAFVAWWSTKRSQLKALGGLLLPGDTANAALMQPPKWTKSSGPPLQLPPFWVNLSWFIPFWRWWFPYQYTKEMALDEHNKNPTSLRGWWACWVLSGFLSWFVARGHFLDKLTSLATYKAGLALDIASALFCIIAGFLLMPVMTCIQQRVERLNTHP